MKLMKPTSSRDKSVEWAIRLRPRIYRGEEIAMGPGKAELLEHIIETGSLRKAAERMNMSYMRAWTLVQTMNHCFKRPIVELRRGGAHHGAAVLTETGKTLLALYRQFESESLRAAQPIQQALKKHFR